jgi:hypothetical protein
MAKRSYDVPLAALEAEIVQLTRIVSLVNASVDLPEDDAMLAGGRGAGLLRQSHERIGERVKVFGNASGQAIFKARMKAAKAMPR